MPSAFALWTLATLGLVTGCRRNTLEDPRITALDGHLRESRIYRSRVAQDRSADWLTISVDGATLGPMRAESGLDIDAVMVSHARCDDAACVGNLEADSTQSVDFVLSPGAIDGLSSDPEESSLRLVGTLPGGQFVDPASATLTRIDASREAATGFVSLGTNGRMLVHFVPPLAAQQYIYLAIVGKPVIAGQAGDDIVESPRRSPPLAFFHGEVNWSDAPRSCPDERVASARQAGIVCSHDSEYRQLLRSAVDAQLPCLQSKFADVAALVAAVSLDTLPLRCYTSREDPGCGTAAIGGISIDEAKFGATDRPCGATRLQLMMSLLLDAVLQKNPRRREQIQLAIQQCADTTTPMSTWPLLARARTQFLSTGNLANYDLDGDGCSNYLMNGHWDANCDGMSDADKRASDQRTRFDLDGDGRADLVRESFANSQGWKGHRDLIDRNRDGRADLRVSTVWSPDGSEAETLRETDDTFTNQFVVEWQEHITGFVSQRTSDLNWSKFDQEGCSPEQSARLFKAWNEMLDRGAACLFEISPTISQIMQNLVAKARTLTITCKPLPPSTAGEVDLVDLMNCNALTAPQACDVRISVDSKLLADPPDQAEWSKAAFILLHELAHYFLKQSKNHNKSNSQQYEKFDEVYGCGNFCFPEGVGKRFGTVSNQLDCWQCAAPYWGDKAANAQCKDASDHLARGIRPPKRQPRRSVTCWQCDPAKGGYAGDSYDTLQECAAKCPTERTLKCLNIANRYCEPTQDIEMLDMQ